MEAPLVMKEGQRNELEPCKLQVPEDLVPVWVAFHDEVECEVGLGGDYEMVSALACKMAEHALRIAGVLTLVHISGGCPQCWLILLTVEVNGSVIGLKEGYKQVWLTLQFYGKNQADQSLVYLIPVSSLHLGNIVKASL